MADKLNILILHNMGDPITWRSSVRDLEFCLPDYAPEHNYIVHNASLPTPDYVKKIDFHGIILGPTFLCNRYHPPTLAKTLEEYCFIKNSNAFKIAMPQDDYDCNAILESWMIDWEIDLVYTVCPEYWHVLYPKLSTTSKIRLGYTGYVSEKMIEQAQYPRPFSARSVDVGYRASKLPPNFGMIGHIKGLIGEIFMDNALDEGLKLDISTDPKDTIHGEKWFDFIENSRFVLGSNSGSSLLDPEGEFRFKVSMYLSSHPWASFEVVRDACFPMEDGKWSFTAISPRNIEAALLETAQICVPGTYSGIMKLDEHYIPFEPDGSNIKDVLSKMRDVEEVRKMTIACKERFLSIKELRYTYHVREIINEIMRGVSAKKLPGTKPEQMKKLIHQYKGFNERCLRYYWPYARSLRRVKRVAKALGAKKIKELLTNRN